MKKIVTILLLLAVVLWSCDEESLEANQDVNHNADNGKVLYSGITKTDEDGNFISIDMDDWRDNGILEGCYAYPNPATVKWWNFLEGEFGVVIISYKLLSDAYVLVLIRNSKRERIKSPASCYITMGKLSGEKGFSGWKARGRWNLCWRLVSDGTDKDNNRIAPGIYRVFIYATDNEVIYKQLKDTGVTNAPREKYSMVYGDVQVK